MFLMRMRGEARVTENGSGVGAVRLSVLQTSALGRTHGENTYIIRLSYKIMCTVIPH